MRLRRLWHDVVRIGKRELLPRALPAIFVALCFHAAGEMTGYALGFGNVERRYSRYELGRIDHITTQDREAELAG